MNFEPKHKTSEQALSSLMRYCSRAERSTGDCVRLMRLWGVEDKEQAEIIARLQELKFVDDERFAAAYVRDKVQFAGWGAYKIALGLKTKGITKTIAEKALAQLDTEQSKEQLARLLERKFGTIKSGTPYEIRGKLFRFALSRGYNYDEIVEIVDKIKF